MLNLLIIGAGSLGLLMAGKLAAHSRVRLVARTPEQARALEGGLAIVENDSCLETKLPCLVFPSPCPEPPDWILLMVKQQHLDERLLQYIADSMGANTRLACFQNGIGHAERLAAAVPADRVFTAVTTEGAKKENATRVRHTGRGFTWIGREARGKAGFGESEKKLAALLNDAGFKASLSNEMGSIIWNKLLINSVINPLTAILRIPNGELPRSPDSRQLMKALLDEGCRVAEAEGVTVAEDLWERLLAVCGSTADNHSSMLQDVLAGKMTEIDWINGSIIRLSGKRGIDVPAHHAIYRLVKALEFSHRTGAGAAAGLRGE